MKHPIQTGLYIGRFQPFHLGHLSAIKQALKEVDQLIIGIGSSQYHREANNPFTAEERQTMIKKTLKAEEIEDHCQIFLIPDIHNDEKWVAHVKSIVPPFEMVIVGNEGIVKTLFEKADTPVIQVKREYDISATEIRERMQEKAEWEQMVHPTSIEFLKSIAH